MEIIFGKDDEATTSQQSLPITVQDTSDQPKEQFYIIEEFTTDGDVHDATQFDQIEDSADLNATETKPESVQTPKKKFDRFDCYLCNKQFPGNLKFMQHFTDEHPESEIRYTCFVCQAFVKKYRSYTRHLESHSTKRFTCDKCDKSFSQKITLVQHLNSHSLVKTYQCTECHLNFKQNSSLFKHRRQKHTNGVIECNECKKTFVNNETLLQHLRSKHKAESNISCSFCSKKFASRSALIYHKASQHTASDDKSRSCKICNKVFKTAVILTRHMKKIH